MPVVIERLSGAAVTPIGSLRERRLRRGALKDRGAAIEIGLVNNMPDAALLATERQFVSLLQAASGPADVRLHLFALRDVPRSEETRAALTRTYRDAAQLRSAPLDALIVTGAEPIAPTLAEEPYWRALTDLIDWADANTVSTILSCLAAHAGVLHLDAIARQPLPTKTSGVFAFPTVGRHKLVSGLDGGVLAPHSRRNGLDYMDLLRRQYEVLAYDSRIGVDTFVKQRRSLFVFLQGHPEYVDESLAREYRRDMNRFLRGEQDAAPTVPTDYFPRSVEHAMAAFAERAWLERRPDLMESFPDTGVFGAGEPPWRKSAVRLYANWLDIVAERKAALRDNTPIAATRWGG